MTLRLHNSYKATTQAEDKSDQNDYIALIIDSTYLRLS